MFEGQNSHHGGDDERVQRVTRRTRSKLIPVDLLPTERQGFVLGMVQAGEFPAAVLRSRHAWFRVTRFGVHSLSEAGQERLMELDRLGYGEAIARGRYVAPQLAEAASKRTEDELRAPVWETTLRDAISSAYSAATEHCMPQTVFRDADSGGWHHTNAFARRLGCAEVVVTTLPERYFR